MRNGLAVFAAVCMSSMILGCGSSKPQDQKKDNTPKKQEAKTWSLTLQSKCAATVEEGKCIGEHGLTILQDGSYKVGPAPTGQMREGKISDEDLQKLNAQLDGTMKAQKPTEQHLAIEVAQSDDTVTFTKGTSAPQILLKTSGADLSFTTSSGDEAKALYASMRDLASRYYPATFPDACVDGALQLQSMYKDTQSCTTDADCTYVSGLQAMDADNIDYIFTDQCTLANPLAVANKSKIDADSDKLNALLAQVIDACGDTFYGREGCEAETGFYPNGKAPTCVANVCQASPEVLTQ